jgi:D-Tyr-tRNAtyr deacylase
MYVCMYVCVCVYVELPQREGHRLKLFENKVSRKNICPSEGGRVKEIVHWEALQFVVIQVTLLARVNKCERHMWSHVARMEKNKKCV